MKRFPALGKDKEMANFLVKLGANPDVENENGMTVRQLRENQRREERELQEAEERRKREYQAEAERHEEEKRRKEEERERKERIAATGKVIIGFCCASLVVWLLACCYFLDAISSLLAIYIPYLVAMIIIWTVVPKFEICVHEQTSFNIMFSVGSLYSIAAVIMLIMLNEGLFGVIIIDGIVTIIACLGLTHVVFVTCGGCGSKSKQA